jgi:streptogramin lyase
MSRATLFVIASLLAASASGSASVRPPAAHHAVARSHGGWMAPAANTKHPWIYVSGFITNNVLIYDLALFGVPQIGSITTGISGPRGLFLDTAGTLYVTNTSGGTVTLYPAGATAPSLTLSQGLSQPVYAAADGQGNVWVTSRGTPPSIVIYPPGGTTPSRTITDSLIQLPEQLAFDSVGNMYFGDDITGVSEILAGTTRPVSLNLSRLVQGSTEGVALGPLDGTMFVSFGNYTDQVNAYADDRRRLRRVLSVPTADSLTVGRFDNHEDLFVPGSQTNTVYVFRDRAASPFTSFSVATSYTRGVAFKPAGLP